MIIEHLNCLHRSWACRLGAMGLALGLFSVTLDAQSSPTAAPDTYRWSAELVGLDETARTVTLKAPIVGSDAADWSEFTLGDSVTLLWSGAHDYAFGIRRVAAGRALEHERFAMPAEFVSEIDGRYVSFTVTLPAEGIEEIKALDPGDWVTATSPVAPPDRLTKLASIRPYITAG